MTELKPLQRFANGIPAYYDGDGQYVYYAAAKSREKLLVDALRDVVAGTYSHPACVRGRELLSQFDAEEHK